MISYYYDYYDYYDENIIFIPGNEEKVGDLRPSVLL